MSVAKQSLRQCIVRVSMGPSIPIIHQNPSTRSWLSCLPPSATHSLMNSAVAPALHSLPLHQEAARTSPLGSLEQLVVLPLAHPLEHPTSLVANPLQEYPKHSSFVRRYRCRSMIPNATAQSRPETSDRRYRQGVATAAEEEQRPMYFSTTPASHSIHDLTVVD